MTVLAGLFWVLLAVPAWAFAGYPAAMILWSRIAPRPPRLHGSDPSTPSVTVVIAARDEAERIVARVENALGQEYPADLLDVVVVSNGVDDPTAEVCRDAYREDPRVRVIESPEAEGKAGSLNRGVEAANGEVVVFADARQRFEPDVVRRLVAGLQEPDVGAVSGRLAIDTASDAAVRGVGSYWGLETRLRDAESRTGSVVGCTGAVYAIRRELYVPLPPRTVLDDVLTPMNIALGGWGVRFEPDAVALDVPSVSAGREYERKVRTLAGNLQILGLEPRLLSPRRNPLFFRYLSHRVLRVAAPWCLVAATVLGAFLPAVPYGAISAAVFGVFVLGGLGLVTGLSFLSPFAGFLVVNVAACVALWRSVRTQGDVWRPTS